MNLTKILLNRHLSDILSKGAAFSFFQILGKILGFLYAWLIVKWFGDSAWGQLVFAITIVMILKNTGQFGFQNALTKFIASNNKDKNSSAIIFYYKKTMMFVISLSLLLTFIFYFNARWVSETFIKESENLEYYLKIIIFSIAPLAITTINGSLLRGMKEISKFSFVVNCLLFFLLVCLLIILHFANLDSSYLPMIYLMASFMSAIISTILTLKVLKKEFRKSQTISTSNKPTFNQIYIVAYPLFISSFSFLALNWTDSLFIGYYHDETQVGIYNIIMRYGSIIIIGLNAVNAIAAPKISEFWSDKNISDLGRFCNFSASIAFLAAFPIVIFYFIFPDFLLGLFNDSFIEGKTTLFVISAGFLVNATSGSAGNVLMMTNKQNIYKNILLVSVLINIALDFILIPQSGILGASIAFSVAMIFWNIASLVYIYKVLNIWVGLNPVFLFRKMKTILRFK